MDTIFGVSIEEPLNGLIILAAGHLQKLPILDIPHLKRKEGILNTFTIRVSTLNIYMYTQPSLLQLLQACSD